MNPNSLKNLEKGRKSLGKVKVSMTLLPKTLEAIPGNRSDFIDKAIAYLVKKKLIEKISND